MLKEGEIVNSFIIVENGLLELSTDFDGNRFSVIRMGQGSVINQQKFFLEDEMTLTLFAN